LNMGQTESSETSAYKIQTPDNYPEERIQHTEHGKSLKSRIQVGCYRRFERPCCFHFRGSRNPRRILLGMSDH